MSNQSFNSAFKQETRDLVNESARGKLPDVCFSDAEIKQVLSLLGQNRSVLIHGLQGVGKTALINGLPMQCENEEPVFGKHHALKLRGQFGGKIRSSLTCGHDLVLQNTMTSSENKDLAIKLISSWRQFSGCSDKLIRKIEFGKAFLLHDFLSGIRTGKKQSLTGPGYHQILCSRINADAASKN